MQIDKDLIYDINHKSKNLWTQEVCTGEDPTALPTVPAGTTGRRQNGNTKTCKGRLSARCRAPRLLISTVNVITIEY